MSSADILSLVKLIQIPTLTMLAGLNLSGKLYPPQRVVANNSCFDYIVVGGGTAGCAVGARLTEIPNSKVLILEAGGDPPIISYLPPAFPIFTGSVYDKNYTSTFDSYAASSQYNYTKLSAGKVLGGTSSINHLILARASKENYDNWADVTGDDSWNYENVLRYLKKKEKLEDPEIKDSIYVTVHGLDGPGAITRQPRDYADRYIEAFNETGSRTPLDLTGELNLGYAHSLFILNSKGIRQNTAYTYLTPIRLKRNLYVLRNTNVNLILFEGKRAVGVVAVRNGITYVYRASKEIILSAGVFNSAKLLMLSGIGPKKHLESLNITVKANLPVGENLQDQVASPIAYKMEASILPPPLDAINPLKVPFPVLIGLAALNKTQRKADYQVFGLLLEEKLLFLKLACAVVFQFRADLCDQFYKSNTLHNSFFALVTKTQPHSTGHVRLRSKDPSDAPLITTGFYTNKTDLEDMADYIIDFRKVEKSTYFKKVKAELVNPNLEQCKTYSFGTKDYWKCYVLHTAGSPYHNCGTCAMASVVDSKLKVYNFTNLRVVDASVMNSTDGSPYETVLMIAEKAADMIKADADKESTCSKLYGNVEEDCPEDKSTSEESNRYYKETKFKPGVKYSHKSSTTPELVTTAKPTTELLKKAEV